MKYHVTWTFRDKDGTDTFKQENIEAMGNNSVIRKAIRRYPDAVSIDAERPNFNGGVSVRQNRWEWGK